MNSIFKPIAFCISKKEITRDPKFFSSNIQCFRKTIFDWHLNIWYIGELPEKSKNNFYFSFPQKKTLLDRNLIISIKENSIWIENDWLGSIPVFYNKKEKVISTIPNLCLFDVNFDYEGLENYFEFGYSVYEQTPFSEVKFLRFYSKLKIEDGKIHVSYKKDPVENIDILQNTSEPKKVIKEIKEYINEIEKIIDGEIIIPTSGGYDSRLLNWAINKKSKIRAFTYGISHVQANSKEVIFAKYLSEKLKLKWEHIPLSDFNNYISKWHEFFGYSTHLHGMYQIEFYDKILEKYRLEGNSTLLSGIIGDAWAGSISLKKIKSPADIYDLGYSHGIKLDSGFRRKKSKQVSSIHEVFTENKSKINEEHHQIIHIMRNKIILLSYLISIPEYFGIPAWTPFLNFNIAIKMLSLPKNSRVDRKWQSEIFKEHQLDIENQYLKFSRVNKLNNLGARNHMFSPIDHEVFKGILNPSKINRLNRKINKQNTVIEYILNDLKVLSILRRLGYKSKLGFGKNLANYYVLKAIEKSIKKS